MSKTVISDEDFEIMLHDAAKIAQKNIEQKALDRLYRRRFSGFSKPLRAAVLILVPVLIVTVLFSSNVGAYRRRFLNYVMNKRGGYVEFTGDTLDDMQGGSSYSNDAMDLEYIPKDFKVKSTSTRHLRLYNEDKPNEYIIVDACELGGAIDIYIDAAAEDITLNGLDGIFMQDDEKACAVWNDDDYIYTVMGTVSKNEIIKIAEGIKIK